MKTVRQIELKAQLAELKTMKEDIIREFDDRIQVLKEFLESESKKMKPHYDNR